MLFEELKQKNLKCIQKPQTYIDSQIHSINLLTKKSFWYGVKQVVFQATKFIYCNKYKINLDFRKHSLINAARKINFIKANVAICSSLQRGVLFVGSFLLCGHKPRDFIHIKVSTDVCFYILQQQERIQHQAISQLVCVCLFLFRVGWGGWVQGGMVAWKGCWWYSLQITILCCLLEYQSYLMFKQWEQTHH